MPPRSSHPLQPLDIGCFSPWKQAYRALIKSKAWLGYKHVNQLDFLSAYSTAHKKTFRPDVIQNSFTATGIRLLNPQKVLEKLHNIITSSPPGSRDGTSIASLTLATPQTDRQQQEQASSVKKLHKKGSQSPCTLSNRALQQIIKGCEMAIYNAAVLTKEIMISMKTI